MQDIDSVEAGSELTTLIGCVNKLMFLITLSYVLLYFVFLAIFSYICTFALFCILIQFFFKGNFSVCSEYGPVYQMLCTSGWNFFLSFQPLYNDT